MRVQAHHEIERKFLVKRFPDQLVKTPTMLKEKITQGYFFDGDKLIRLRKVEAMKRCSAGLFPEVTYWKCHKEGQGLDRLEYELSIPLAEFTALWNYVRNWQLSKTRYNIFMADGYKAELDCYNRAPLKGFWTVEVEFNTVEEANAFVPPDWFGKDVTDRPEFGNANLARLMDIRDLHLD